jgi:hypothetical protein
MGLYYIGSIDKLLGTAVQYGTVYRTLTSAKKALAAHVKESKQVARSRGYGTTYAHWSDSREFCRITLAKDERSSLWETLAVRTCTPGVPYMEVVK